MLRILLDNEPLDSLTLPNKVNRPDPRHVHFFPIGPEMADADEKISIIHNDISICHCTRTITKIILGAQTCAGQATLDLPIEKGIPHGGWTPKGRLTEAGMLPEKYQLKEMETPRYPKRTEQNVIDSDGTLIVSHRELTGGSSDIPQTSEKHWEPWIHIDPDAIPIKEATEVLCFRFDENQREVLNVAGARASKDATSVRESKRNR
jgi:hypothetical protein